MGSAVRPEHCVCDLTGLTVLDSVGFSCSGSRFRGEFRRSGACQSSVRSLSLEHSRRYFLSSKLSPIYPSTHTGGAYHAPGGSSLSHGCLPHDTKIAAVPFHKYFPCSYGYLDKMPFHPLFPPSLLFELTGLKWYVLHWVNHFLKFTHSSAALPDILWGFKLM